MSKTYFNNYSFGIVINYCDKNDNHYFNFEYEKTVVDSMCKQCLTPIYGSLHKFCNNCGNSLNPKKVTAKGSICDTQHHLHLRTLKYESYDYHKIVLIPKDCFELSTDYGDGCLSTIDVDSICETLNRLNNVYSKELEFLRSVYPNQDIKFRLLVEVIDPE